MRVSAELKAGTEQLSRQLRWKIIKFRSFSCINCGQSRGDSPYKRMCTVCGETRKKARRRKLGSKAWKPGRPGRPPLKVAQKDLGGNE